jgi:hypothetical protein
LSIVAMTISILLKTPKNGQNKIVHLQQRSCS